MCRAFLLPIPPLVRAELLLRLVIGPATPPHIQPWVVRSPESGRARTKPRLRERRGSNLWRSSGIRSGHHGALVRCVWVCYFVCRWLRILVGCGQPTLLWDSVYWAGDRGSGWICVWFLSCRIGLGCVAGGDGLCGDRGFFQNWLM